MQQAEVEMLALIQNTREQNAAAAQAQAHLLPPSEVKTENSMFISCKCSLLMFFIILENLKCTYATLLDRLLFFFEIKKYIKNVTSP